MADGLYRTINATELSWLGCTREDVVGKLRPSDFYTPEGREAFAHNRGKPTICLYEMSVQGMLARRQHGHLIQ